jgi:hypothetical protein
VVLRSVEVAVINGRIDAYNDVIRNTAAAMGAKVLEIKPFLERVNQGYFVYGGIEVNADFLLGGFFSYDGIHPQNVGYAMFANYLINLINDEYRADIPDVNLYQILVEGAENDPPAAATSIDAKSVFTQEAFRALQRAFPLLGPLNSQREISGHEIQVPSSKRELVH